MDWKDIQLRKLELRDGDLCVVEVCKQYCHAGCKLGVYRGNHLWDAIVLDDPDTWLEEWTILDDVAYRFAKTGINVFDNIKNIN